jgi:hypothetical protein
VALNSGLSKFEKSNVKMSAPKIWRQSIKCLQFLNPFHRKELRNELIIDISFSNMKINKCNHNDVVFNFFDSICVNTFEIL